MAIKLRAVISKTRAARVKAKVQDEFSDVEEDKPERPTEVPSGPELLRILGLERRAIPDLESEDAQRVADFLTERFRLVPREELFPGPLLPVQGVAIREAWEAQGLFGQIGVGRGKQLTAWLIAGLFNLERMIYVCQGDGAVDAAVMFSKYRRCWKGPSERSLPIVSYELISNGSSDEELDDSGKVVRPGRLSRMRPQLIILDEAHNCSSTGSKVTKQIDYYLRHNPNTIVIVLTGTPYKTSINDASHLFQWALKKNAPLPTDWTERMAWAGYLDAKEGLFGRTEIGELTQLADLYDVTLNLWDKRAHAQDELRSQVRRLVAQRILETPGVIGTQDPPLDVGLTLEPWYPEREDEELTAKLLDMRMLGCTPDGMPFADSMALSRHESTMALDFWQKTFTFEGFTRCLEKTSSVETNGLGSDERRILKAIASANDVTQLPHGLVAALRSAQRTSRTDEPGSYRDLMVLASKSTTPCTGASTVAAGTQAVASPARMATSMGREQLLSSITTTRQGPCAGFSAPAATWPSESWETALRAWPRLLPILKGAWETETMPPVEWKKAKTAWSKWCRRAIKKNGRRLHSEGQVKKAVRKGLYPIGAKKLEEWERQEKLEQERTGLREPNVVCEWESEECLEHVRKWVAQYGGLVWVEHIGLGERLAKELGVPYYGAGGGKDTVTGRNIREHQGGPAVASVSACGTGKNLQHFWSSNLWLTPPGEQSMARTHRLGQKAKVVTNHVYLGCARHLDAFERAKEVKAVFQADMTLAPQKLRFADCTIPDVDELAARGGERWRSRSLDIDDEDDDFDCAI